MTAKRKRIPRWVWTLVKLALAACVVALMVHAGAIRPEHLEHAAKRWPLLLAALGTILVGIFLTSVRWGVLLRAQDIRIRVTELFRLTMTGLFFTLVAPGGLGGDAIKAYFVGRGREKKAEAATTVFLDRFLGLATMFLAAAAMIAVDFDRLWNAEVKGLDRFGMPGGRVLVILIAACMGSMVVFSAAMMSRRLRRTGLFAAVSRLVPFRRTVRRVYRAIHLYRDHPGALCWAALVSIGAQIPLYVIYYLYGIAVGADIQLWHVALIVPPAMVIRVLPLAPGGVGQGAFAMSLLFPLVGLSSGGDIGAVGDAMFVIVYLIGGLFFLFGKASFSEMRAAAELAAGSAAESGAESE